MLKLFYATELADNIEESKMTELISFGDSLEKLEESLDKLGLCYELVEDVVNGKNYTYVEVFDSLEIFVLDNKVVGFDKDVDTAYADNLFVQHNDDKVVNIGFGGAEMSKAEYITNFCDYKDVLTAAEYEEKVSSGQILDDWYIYAGRIGDADSQISLGYIETNDYQAPVFMVLTKYEGDLLNTEIVKALNK